MNKLKYNAFISYRHVPRDMEVAKEIQQQLERFNIPSEIKEKYSIEKITRIFRDQEELELTDDLSAKLEDNLKNSEYLIVICSDEYKKSPWCLKEVESFVKDKGREKVICVMADGEPPEVFPEILLREETVKETGNGKKTIIETNIEPLACDYRGDFGEARKTELPRLAAKLIGCSYDELVMRQEKKKKKKTRNVFMLVSIASAIIISYLVWSNNQITQNYRKALINESRIMANQSLDYIDRKEGLNALSLALEALPTDEKSEKPVTEEALYALSRASYAYQIPYTYAETGKIDKANNIIDYFISQDQKYLVCLDQAGNVTVSELKENRTETEFNLDREQIPEHIEEGIAGQLITYSAPEVCCYDYIKGQMLWSIPLAYQQIGIARTSHDGSLIAAADSYAIQIMTAKGEMYLSMPLPEEISGYIIDFIWSEDDSRIAVKMKDNGYFRIGYYKVSTSEFTLLPDRYFMIDEFCYGKNNELFVLSDSIVNHSTAFETVKYQYPSQYSLQKYENESLIFTHEIETKTTSECINLRPWKEDGILLTLGNKLSVFDGKGTLIKEAEFEGNIVSVGEETENNIEVVLSDGYLVQLNDNNEEISEKQFRQQAEKVTRTDNKFIVLKEGNLYCYQPVYDENIKYLKEGQLPAAPDDFLNDENHAVILADRELLIWNVKDEKNVGKVTLDKGDAYSLLKLTEEEALLLHVNAKTAEVSVMAVDLNTAELRYEEQLQGIKDYYLHNGYFRYPLSLNDSDFIMMKYKGTSQLAIGDRIITIHGAADPNLLIIYDIEDRSQKQVKITSDAKMVDSTILRAPSPLVLSDDEEMIFTVSRAETSEKVNGLLINLEKQQARSIDVNGIDETLTIWKENKLIVTDSNKMTLFDNIGNKLYQIPFTYEKVLSLDYHDNKLIGVYPDNTLVIYQDGKILREVELDFKNLKYMSAAAFRFEYHQDMLYLYCGNSLAVINMQSESRYPLYIVDQGVLGYNEGRKEIIVYSHKNASEYNLAIFTEYDAEELIERGVAQLNSTRE